MVRPKAHRKAKLSAVVTLSFALTLVGCSGGPETGSSTGSSAKGPSKIVIGVQSQDLQPQALVKPMGWYDKNAGAPVTYADFNGGGAMNQAFQTGDLDIAEMGTPPFALGLNKGIEYKVVFVDNASAKYSEGLVVRKGAGIHSVKDLVGKTVATPSGSSADFMFGRTLAVNGVEPDKVKTINLEPGAIGAAWSAGHIDAAYIWAPVLQTLMKDNGELIASAADLLKTSNDFDGDIIAVKTEFANKYPDSVVTFVTAMICANNFARSRTPAALKMLSDTFSLPESYFTEENMVIPSVEEQQGPVFFGGSPPGLETILKRQTQYFYDTKLVPKLAPDAVVRAAVDRSFLDKAVEKVGPDYDCSS
jgi:taurine transport system substrate-binding protein